MALSPHALELIAKAKAAHAARMAEQAQQAAKLAPAVQASTVPLAANKPEPMKIVLAATNTFRPTTAREYNEKQLEAIERGLRGESFCLIGAAGTGKTTTTQELITQLQRSPHCQPFRSSSKYIVEGEVGILIVGFTNKAVNNIRKGLPTHLQHHCLTIHKLIEFGPVWYENDDPETGKTVKTMQFEPFRHAKNKLPHISTIFVEESSMVGIDLYKQFLNALPHPERTQIIFLGDLNQIPPVFGPSILGFKLAELPTVELTHVYRQALLSPIIKLATAVRTNNTFELPSLLKELTVNENGEHGKVTLHPWKQRVNEATASHFMRSFIPRIIDAGVYNPEEDQILCPFNKAFGTVELNRIIANHLAKQRDAEVFEIIARGQKQYLAVGDRVLFDRHDAVITKIDKNPAYFGKVPRNGSRTMDRWGNDPAQPLPPQLSAQEILNNIELRDKSGDSEEKNAASHIVTVELDDFGITEELRSAGDINGLLMAYALTIHKSQGSEWGRVFLFLHNTHSSLLSRELLYTGITRAKQELYIICEGDAKDKMNSIKAAARRPVIPGTTLKEKIMYFADLARKLARGSNADSEMEDFD